MALDQSEKESILEAAHQMANSALRVLAVASKPRATEGDAETEMTFLGLVGMIDPPRPEAKNAIRVCEQAGIRPVMITGDHPSTAQAVARELGLLKIGHVLTGAELEMMNEDDLDVLDSEAAILSGRIEETQAGDPRGTKYVIVGSACDQTTPVGVVVRFVEKEQLLVITVYELE